jgi:hypothetical protein
VLVRLSRLSASLVARLDFPERGVLVTSAKTVIAQDVWASISRRSHGSIVIEGDHVLYRGQLMHGLLSERLVEALEAGGQYFDRLIAFADNYYANPSYRAREQLWPFLEKGQNPIDEHGRFLAWQLVRSDYRDIYTGNVANHVGAVIEMDPPRWTMIRTEPAPPVSTSAHGTTYPASARLVARTTGS